MSNSPMSKSIKAILGGLIPAAFLLSSVSCADTETEAKKKAAPEAAEASTVAVTGVGEPITEAQLAKWDISVFFDGDNLPPGKGTLTEGEEIYQAQCAMCHGEFGESVRGYPKLLGGTMDEYVETAKNNENNVAVRGINNHWGHAPTLYDYIHRAMPFFAPQSLSVDQAYSVTGYVLYLAEITDGSVEDIDADYIKSIKMPAADLYYTDNRPDVKNERCMSDCYTETAEVVKKQIKGDVSVGAADEAAGQ